MKSHQHAAPAVSQLPQTPAEEDAQTGLPAAMCVGSALGALRRGDLGSFFTWGAEEKSVANLLMTGLVGRSCKVGDETFDATGAQATLEGLLASGIDGLGEDKKAQMVRFCGNLSHANQVLFFEWLQVPLQTATGAPAKVNPGTGAPQDDLLGQAELPLVLQGLLQLPTRFWQDPASLRTYEGIRPGAASAYTGRALTAVSLDTRVATAREKASGPISEDEALARGKQAFADGVSHEIGHTVDNAMAGAHTALMAALGFSRLSGPKALVGALGLAGDAATAGASIVEDWMSETSAPKSRDELRASVSPDAWSRIADTALVDVLVKSADPAAVEKPASGYAIYQRAGEIQVWGPTLRAHLASWGNDKAALSDREYCAELFRCYFQAGSDQAAVLASYPDAARDWIAKASAFDGNRG